MPARSERGPEPVAGPGEVGVDRGGPQTGVDTHEQEPQVRAEQVVDGVAAEGLELGTPHDRRRLPTGGRRSGCVVARPAQ